MDTYIYELFNILPDIITRTIIICIILNIIQFVIFISFILWVRLTAKNTGITANNIIELDKRQQERQEQLITALQYQSKLLKEQNEQLTTQNRMFAHIISKQQPTAQQAPEEKA